MGVAQWRRHWRVWTGNGHDSLVQLLHHRVFTCGGVVLGSGVVVRLVWAVNTLLSPEETTLCCPWLVVPAVVVGGAGCGWWLFFLQAWLWQYTGPCVTCVRGGGVLGVVVGVVGWSLVENCTVDASILFSVVCCVVWFLCVVWLSCQGRTVDALAPGADEGRGRPR